MSDDERIQKLLVDPDGALGALLAHEPRLEVRHQVFPERRVVIAVIFANAGAVTIPLLAEQAREMASALDEAAEAIDADPTTN